ncbi:hypothetical protein Cgig2_033961 [Carnegiea gigantea]|uniref:Uncharacterized protein n=1 Tax=Carnegiea gigantea TaxID=171969 RepID=A0A9Q1QGF5_9CARY|nr:hypothetical protein Cgig2_033961 [Carnegiea gigantea]
MEAPVSMRRPCFVKDDGLASVAEMETGFSGNMINFQVDIALRKELAIILFQHILCFPCQLHTCLALFIYPPIRGSSAWAEACCLWPIDALKFGGLRSKTDEVLAGPSVWAGRLEQRPCDSLKENGLFLGPAELSGWAARGYSFYSEECKQEQIEIDEAKEKSRKIKVLRSKKQKTKSAANSSSSSSFSPTKSQNYPFRTGTVAAT